MKANKTTAFISGVVVTLGALFIESNGYHFAWVVAFFFPGILIFTIGFEPWRAWATGDRESISWPDNSTSWHILQSAWFRMFVFFIGACVAGVINAIYIQI